MFYPCRGFIFTYRETLSTGQRFGANGRRKSLSTLTVFDKPAHDTPKADGVRRFEKNGVPRPQMAGEI
jgi:hypothetical protein